MIEDHVQQKGACKKKTLNTQVCDLEQKVLFFTVLQDILEIRDLVRIKNQVNFFFHSQGEELAAFEVVVLQMLEDVQERLVYRAQVITNTVIKNRGPPALCYQEHNRNAMKNIKGHQER